MNLLAAGMLGCTVWIPVAIWIYAMISWMISDEIDIISGIFGLGAATSSGAYVMIRYQDPATPWIVAAIWSIVLVYPSVKSAADKRSLVKTDFESMELAYEQLSLRPNNLGSVMKIAGFACKYGAPEHGIAAAETALKAYPKNLVHDDWRQVRTWQSVHDLREDYMIACAECGHMNKPGSVLCKKCGREYLLMFAQGRWTGKEGMRGILTVWIAAVAAILGVGFASATLTRTNAALASVGILGLCGTAAWMALRLAKPTR